MNDAAHRTIERAAAQGTDPADRARLLRARLYAGTVTAEMLAAAGYLGDAAARLVVLAWGLNPRPSDSMGHVENMLAHAPIPKPVRIRLALDMAERAMVAYYARVPDWPIRPSDLPRACAEACRAWLADPTEENERRAHVTARAVEDWQGDDDIDPLPSAVARVGMAIGWHEWCAGSAADFATRLGTPDECRREREWQVQHALSVLTGDVR